jgi:hypothetical protein
MTRLYRRLGAVTITAAFFASLTPAIARPPTVQPSPGYDRRLQESRKAMMQPTPILRPTRAKRHAGKRSH